MALARRAVAPTMARHCVIPAPARVAAGARRSVARAPLPSSRRLAPTGYGRLAILRAAMVRACIVSMRFGADMPTLCVSMASLGTRTPPPRRLCLAARNSLCATVASNFDVLVCILLMYCVAVCLICAMTPSARRATLVVPSSTVAGAPPGGASLGFLRRQH